MSPRASLTVQAALSARESGPRAGRGQ